MSTPEGRRSRLENEGTFSGFGLPGQWPHRVQQRGCRSAESVFRFSSTADWCKEADSASTLTPIGGYRTGHAACSIRSKEENHE
jgi:hypothetical protein